MATNEEYRKVDIEILEALSVMLDAPEIWENREKYMIDKRFAFSLKDGII